MKPLQGSLVNAENALSVLTALGESFFELQALTRGVDEVGIKELPPACRELLAHEEHMTLRLENRLGRVTLHVLEERFHGDLYDRMILLKLRGTESVCEEPLRSRTRKEAEGRKSLPYGRGSVHFDPSQTRSKKIVEFGLVRMNLRLMAPEVRQEVLSKTAPLT